MQEINGSVQKTQVHTNLPFSFSGPHESLSQQKQILSNRESEQALVSKDYNEMSFI